MPNHSPETNEDFEEVIQQQPAWVTDIHEIGLDNAILETIVPHPLPDDKQLVPYFRDNYRGLYADSGHIRRPPSHYIPGVMAVIMTGNRALITDKKTPDEEKAIVHQAISLSGFDHGDFPNATQVCLEVEDAILNLRQTYRQRLALQQTVEAGLATALETPESSYRLAKVLAHTYSAPDKTPVSLSHQGLLELLITPLEPNRVEKPLPHILLGRLATGEFSSFIAKDVVAQNLTGKQQLYGPPTPHLQELANFSHSLTSNLNPVPDDDSLAAILAKMGADGLWPKEATPELINTEKSFNDLFAKAIGRATASVVDQGWHEFGDASKAFSIARTELLIQLSDWAGWPFSMADLRPKYVADLRALKQGPRRQGGGKQSKRQNVETVDDSEGLRRNTLTYVDKDGNRHSLDSPKASAINTYLYKDAEKSKQLLEPIFQFLERFDFASYDKKDRKTQFIRPTGRETEDGRQIYRLILGQLQGANAIDNRVRVSQLIFSVSTTPDDVGNEVYVHSFADSATYTLVASNVAQRLQESVPATSEPEASDS